MLHRWSCNWSATAVNCLCAATHLGELSFSVIRPPDNRYCYSQRADDGLINHSRLAGDSYQEERCGRYRDKKRREETRAGKLASRGLDPWLEPVRERTKGAEKRERHGTRRKKGEAWDPQKFSSQNEGLIADAISLGTLRCRTASHVHINTRVRMFVCTCVCRCNPRPPTCQPAR